MKIKTLNKDEMSKFILNSVANMTASFLIP